MTILHGLAEDRETGQGSGARLVGACVSALDVTGAGIMIMFDGGYRGTLGSSDATMGVVEDLQFTLGEGPCLDSYRLGRPVFEPSLADPITPRWPSFTPPALEAGVHAIFGFPLQVGAIRLGALDVYLDRPGDLSKQQLADALVMADVVTHEILELQAGAPPDALASELDTADNLQGGRAPGIGHARRPARRPDRGCTHPPARLHVRREAAGERSRPRCRGTASAHRLNRVRVPERWGR